MLSCLAAFCIALLRSFLPRSSPSSLSITFSRFIDMTSIPLTFCLGFRNWYIEHLHHALDSLRRITTDEIIVVDYGSGEHAASAIKNLCSTFTSRYLREESDLWSRARALNRASREARTDYIVCTDADMIFPSSWYESVQSQLVPSGLFLTRTRDLPPTLPETEVAFEDENWLIENSVLHPTVGQGGAMVIPRAWFVAVGGFDERFTVWCCEDKDLVIRALWSKVPVRWFDQTFVAHQWHWRDWPTPEEIELVKSHRRYFAERIAAGGPIVRNQQGGDEHGKSQA